MTTAIMPLETHFTLSVDEFLEGQRLYNRFLAPRLARITYRFYVPLGVLLVAQAIVLLVLRLNIGFSLFLLVFGGYLLSCRTIIAPKKMKKEFTQYPDQYWNQNWQFGEDRILVQTSHGKSEIDWTRFSRFIETNDLFVLFTPPRFLHVIPKRAFSPETSEQFCGMVRRKVSS